MSTKLFNTTEEEIKATKKWLEKNKIEYKDILKTSDKDDGDILITFKDGSFSLIEVKEESEYRFKKYEDYGIDFISVFHYQKGREMKSGIYSSQNFDKLFASIDSDKKYKLGKLFYSNANAFLFYVKNSSGEYEHLECIKQSAFQDEKLLKKIKESPFAINNKKDHSLSDTWESAVVFVNNKEFLKYRCKSKEDIIRNPKVFATFL